jgi:hypothetical protein
VHRRVLERPARKDHSDLGPLSQGTSRVAPGFGDVVGDGKTYRVRRRDAGWDLACSIESSSKGGAVSVAPGPDSWVHVPH